MKFWKKKKNLKKSENYNFLHMKKNEDLKPPHLIFVFTLKYSLQKKYKIWDTLPLLLPWKIILHTKFFGENLNGLPIFNKGWLYKIAGYYFIIFKGFKKYFSKIT